MTIDRQAMKQIGSRLARRVRARQGYTLIELLWVISLTTVVVGVPMTFIVLSLEQQNVSSSRTAAATQEEVAMARLTRDLHQVVPGTTTTLTWASSAASIVMTLPAPGTEGVTNETVTWNCNFSSAGTGSCTRSVNGGTAVPEMSNVVLISFAPVDASGTPLTSPASNPAYVGLTAKVLDVSQLDTSQTHAVQGVNNPITLQDGVDLLNNTL